MDIIDVGGKGNLKSFTRLIQLLISCPLKQKMECCSFAALKCILATGLQFLNLIYTSEIIKKQFISHF
ncbi:hypothetical protein BVRB_6g144540 isoform A [Beta vulgaris subsp. vulgaris]|nr:hypothetical protein BVRB_6g144540 isoform A [Beta vulgaris subsp. vulgaris]